MKNKSYLLGYGSGMIVCALIIYVVLLLIGDNNAYYVDEQYIISKATELGMVFPEEDDVENDYIEGNISNNNDEVISNITDNEDENLTEIPQDVDEDLSEEVDNIDEGLTEETNDTSQTDEVDEAIEIDDNNTEENIESEDVIAEDSYYDVTFVVESGSTSYDVTDILFENNLIDDKESFNQYLIQNNYNTKIKTGTFTVSSNSTYEELANALTN